MRIKQKLVVLFFILFAVTVVLGKPVEAVQQISLIQGQSRVMNFEKVTRVAIGDEHIADVLVLSADQVLINGKEKGRTSIDIWLDDGSHKSYQVRVFADDGVLIKELLTYIDLPDISAWFIDEHLILDGEVTNQQEKERAKAVASAFSDSVISLLQGPNSTQLDHLIKKELTQLISEDIEVTVINNTIILEGEVTDEFKRQRAIKLSEAFERTVIDLILLPEEQEEKDIHSSSEPELSIVDQLNEILSDKIIVNKWGNSLFLEGTVASPSHKEKALAVSEAFGKPVVSFLEVSKSAQDELSNKQVEDYSPSLTDELNLYKRILANDELSIIKVYDQIIIEGLTTSWEKHRAAKIAEAFSFSIIDLIQTKENIPPEKTEKFQVADEDIEAQINHPNINASWINKTIFLEGLVDDDYQKKRALAIAQAYADKVVDLIRVKSRDNESETETETKSEKEDSDKEKSDKEQANFYDNLLDDVQTALQEPRVSSNFHRDALVLEGQVDSLSAKERAIKIASLYYQPTISFLQVDEPQQKTNAELLNEHLHGMAIDVSSVNNNLILEGTVSDQAEHSRVIEIASLYGDVVDHLHVQKPAQVLLNVVVLEMSRRVGEKLGINWGSLVNNKLFTLLPNAYKFEEVDDRDGWSFNRSFPLGAEIEAEIQTGDAKLLASPSLLALSGEEASFLVGGEIPLVIPGERAALDWKEYGVKLNILPLVLEDKVMVEISPEVSNLDWNNAIEIDNLVYPAMRMRKASTTLTVQEGSTIVLGGLIEHEESTNIRKVPILGDLPILGKLFRSKNFQERQTELVIMITPWIVHQEGVDLSGK